MDIICILRNYAGGDGAEYYKRVACQQKYLITPPYKSSLNVTTEVENLSPFQLLIVDIYKYDLKSF